MHEEWPEFNQLLEIAKKDPEALEKYRRENIEKIIASAPVETQRRLRGLQFQIDCKRRIHRTPLASCIEISSMMMDSLSKLNHALNGTAHAPTQKTKFSGSVVPFPVNG